jgi:hypothetical protein
MIIQYPPVQPNDPPRTSNGTRTTGGTRRVVWRYARILNYYLFHNWIFKMLLALLKSF